MSFKTLRLILEIIEYRTGVNMSDFKVVFYTNGQHINIAPKYMIFGKIPDCFNCEVRGHDIDLDDEIICIKCKEVNHE